MSSLLPINPASLPPSIAPFPQAMLAGDLLFISGQVALDAETRVVAPGDVARQTDYVLDRLESILAECGGDLSDVASATVFLRAPDLFADYNQAWARRFGGHLPARATVVSELVVEGLVIEVQAIALVGTKEPPSA